MPTKHLPRRVNSLIRLFSAPALASAWAFASAMAPPALAQPSGKPMKWACIGNSITAGYSVSATDAYPSKLGKLLGPGFAMENDGVASTTLLKAGDTSYWTHGRLANVFAFKPDIVTIKLGTNDSKPINWDAHKGEFERDYLALIDTLSAMPQKPRIILCLPVPAFVEQSGNTGIRGSIVKNEVIPIVKKVADERGLQWIDLNTPMLAHANLFPDSIHPNAVGQDSLAALIYRDFLAKSTRLACIGNSITQYTAQANTDPKDAYPVKLSEMLGAKWYSINEGWSGAYMQKVSPQSYWNSTRLKDVIDYKPDVVTIMLGTNDSRQADWHSDKFIADYESMIDSLNTLNPKPKIWLAAPIPSWMINGAWPYNGISNDIIKGQTLPALKQVAKDKGLDIIDANTPFQALARLVPDGVHPIAAGQDSLAHIIYRAIAASIPTTVPAQARPTRWPEVDLRAGLLRVTLPGVLEARARLFSADGREVSSAGLMNGAAAALAVSGLAPGRYFLTVEAPAEGLHAVKTLSL